MVSKKFFGLLFGRKVILQIFLLALLKSLTYSKNPARKPSSKSLLRHKESRLWLLKLFRKPPALLKIVPKAPFDVHLRKMDK